MVWVEGKVEMKGSCISLFVMKCLMLMCSVSSDGYVIGHYANNARDFLYPAIPPYPGSGRELTLFKTSLFNPIRITVSTNSTLQSTLRN